MNLKSQMRPTGCLLCLIIFTIARACAREHSISKHETWFWEPFNPDLSGATIFDPHDDHITATNVYFHTNRFYSLVEATNTTASDTTNQKIHQSKKFAHNSAITPLPLTNIPNFLSNIKSGWISGTTLLIPFPEVDSPHHMGYWIEVLAPVFSYLSFDKNNNSNSSTIRTVLIPNLSRGTVMSSTWVMDMIKIATTTTTASSSNRSAMKSDKEEKVETPPPRILFWDDLENTPLDSWLGFERILHVYTRYTDVYGKTRSNGASKAATTPTGKRERSFSFGFSSSEIAEKFRLAVHKATGIPPPVPGSALSRTITYLMPTDSSGVTNNKHVLDALHRSAATSTTVDRNNSKINNTKLAVRPYSPTPSVSLASLVAVMSRTGLLIGRHAPLLANAAFLPPGAAVVEILPFNWNSGGRSEIYKNLTASRSTTNNSNITNNPNNINESKSIVHVAWRAPSGDWMRYESEEDSRYASWTPVECSSEHCIDAHARAGVEVNVEEFKRIVDDVIEVIYNSNSSGGSRGEGLKESRLRQKLMEKYPWPRRVDLSGTSGLWWDRG